MCVYNEFNEFIELYVYIYSRFNLAGEYLKKFFILSQVFHFHLINDI